jgi:3-methyladenine DNA glycosylase AlkD
VTATPDERLITEIRGVLRAAADPAVAPGMQAYMKSAMPYLGVRVPAVRALTRAAEQRRPPLTVATVIATAGALWRAASHREERYAATALLDTSTARRLRDVTVLPLLEEMIRSGAWWDHVDEVSHRVGDLLILDRPTMAAVLGKWAEDDDRWIRRSAIIAQLGHKSATDVGLLGFVVEQNLDDREFFITKAIGWALREYARTDSDWVRAFVNRHDGRIAPLSRREALKRLSR